MKFSTSATGVLFEIPDEWWHFAEMERFAPNVAGFYPYREAKGENVEIVKLADVEPPTRNPGTALFKKYKLVPVLFAFASPELVLPPVVVHRMTGQQPYRFKVHNGFHRYYASVAVGYTNLPVVIAEPVDS